MHKEFPQIAIEDFSKVEIRVGTIITAKVNEKASNPSYKLTIDFGEKVGIKTSSAQLVDNYQPNDLIGLQIISVMNFPVKQIATTMSEVLVLACVSDREGTILLQPTNHVQDGTLVG